MYSSCLACHHDLGHNDVLRAFPVGRLIAFDPDEGRLWAVCHRCGEWNLAPISERWEAVEECSTVYASTDRRATISGLSVARADHLELIRVGSSDELPTLRYGEKLEARTSSHRWKRGIARLAQAVLGLGLGVLGFRFAGPGGCFVALLMGVAFLEVVARDHVVARIPISDEEWTGLTRRDLAEMRLVPIDDDDWLVRVPSDLEIKGPEALETLRLVLPLIVRSRPSDRRIGKALRYIQKKGGTVDSVFAAAARRRGATRTARVANLEPHIRLALEILACREAENRAIAGDLGYLTAAWRDAHELAEIQDDLLYSPGILARLRRLKG